MRPMWPSRSAIVQSGHDGTGASTPAFCAATASAAPFERIASTYSSCFTPRPSSTGIYRRRFDEVRAVVRRLVDEHADGPPFELVRRSGNEQRRELLDVVVVGIEPQVPRRFRQDHR